MGNFLSPEFLQRFKLGAALPQRLNAYFITSAFLALCTWASVEATALVPDDNADLKSIP